MLSFREHVAIVYVCYMENSSEPFALPCDCVHAVCTCVCEFMPARLRACVSVHVQTRDVCASYVSVSHWHASNHVCRHSVAVSLKQSLDQRDQCVNMQIHKQFSEMSCTQLAMPLSPCFTHPTSSPPPEATSNHGDLQESAVHQPPRRADRTAFAKLLFVMFYVTMSCCRFVT